MAVVHVDTWAAFKSAVAVQGDTVIVDNDLDANGQIVTSSISVGATYVQGGGHTIYNIYSTTNIFEGTAINTHTFTELNFANIDTSSASGGALFRGISTASYMYIHKCNIQGNLLSIGSGHAEFEQCAIVLRGGAVHTVLFNMNSAGRACKHCYIDLGDNYQQSGSAMFAYCYVQNCYITGTWNLTANTYFIGNSMANTSPYNVFNVYVKSDVARNLAFYSQAGGTPVSIYNADRVDSTVTMLNGGTALHALTDDQMKNAADIAATGFPIIV